MCLRYWTSQISKVKSVQQFDVFNAFLYYYPFFETLHGAISVFWLRCVPGETRSPLHFYLMGPIAFVVYTWRDKKSSALISDGPQCKKCCNHVSTCNHVRYITPRNRIIIVVHCSLTGSFKWISKKILNWYLVANRRFFWGIYSLSASLLGCSEVHDCNIKHDEKGGVAFHLPWCHRHNASNTDKLVSRSSDHPRTRLYYITSKLSNRSVSIDVWNNIQNIFVIRPWMIATSCMFKFERRSYQNPLVLHFLMFVGRIRVCINRVEYLLMFTLCDELTGTIIYEKNILWLCATICHYYYTLVITWRTFSFNNTKNIYGVR